MYFPSLGPLYNTQISVTDLDLVQHLAVSCVTPITSTTTSSTSSTSYALVSGSSTVDRDRDEPFDPLAKQAELFLSIISGAESGGLDNHLVIVALTALK